ncbi:unnamed protein product [Cladocopium goreaui]|uniref:Uncharacterized protein n=1 Tax=Cladocopium goreaui TaxID=2562237 RepID=A0A9P1GDL1_9DINO|nr:unnamed protein product [Cladocopium goreaui]
MPNTLRRAFWTTSSECPASRMVCGWTSQSSWAGVHCTASYSLADLSEAHAALKGHVMIRHPTSSNLAVALAVEHFHGHVMEAGRVFLRVFLGVVVPTDFCLVSAYVSCLSQNSYALRKVYFEIKEHVAPQKWMTRYQS